MSKSKIILSICVVILAVLGGIFFFQNRSGVGGDAPEVDWRKLGELDYISGKASPDLAALEGKMVRIPGFMVPLEDSQKSVTEFLLVPTPQACIHVPPPPPNQMVLVEMDASAQAKVEFGPIWVYGILSLHSKRHQYGESSFTMKGMRIEQYR